MDLTKVGIKDPKVQELVMWKEPKKSGAVLAAGTLGYFFVEFSGYTMLALISNFLLLTVVTCFVWGNIANVIGRAPPPIPQITLDEGMVRDVVEKGCAGFNKAYGFIYKVLSPGDAMLSVKVAAGLWV